MGVLRLCSVMALNEQVSDSKAPRAHGPALCSPRRGGSRSQHTVSKQQPGPSRPALHSSSHCSEWLPFTFEAAGQVLNLRGWGGNGMELLPHPSCGGRGVGGHRCTACGLQQRYGPGTTLLVKVRELVSHSPGLQVGMLPEHNQPRVVTAQETRSRSC